MLEREKARLMELVEEDGLLTVDAVLEDAADKTSPLHRHFTWDNSKAAHEYRRWQARALIAKCRVVTESRPDTEIRAFVSLPSDRIEGGYRLRVDVMDDPDQREELLSEMRARVAYWERQASWLQPMERKALERFARSIQPVTVSVEAATA